MAQTQDFVRSTIGASPVGTCDFVIERDGKPIGKAGMWQRPDIGFFVHPAHQRQGVAREALTAIIPHLFATYPEPVLTADVDPRNHASTALLRSLRFPETDRAARTIEICGEWCDSVYFALDRPA